MIEAIETLESTFKPEKIDKKEENINYNKWTVAQLKDFCSKNNIRVLSSFKKAI